MKRTNGPALWTRVAVSIVIMLVAYRVTLHFPISDLAYPWMASHAIRQHVDAYALVAKTPMPWGSVLFYPLPAGIITLPLSFLPMRLAGAVFSAIGCGVLAFVATRDNWWRLVILLSGPALQACFSAQWSLLLTAAALWPSALWVITAKPNLALPLILFQRTPRALAVAAAGCLVLLAASLFIDPRWPAHWLNTFESNPRAAQYRAPILHPLGFVLGLAALRWRRPEGRLLLGMALTPQNAFFYDQLPLLLVASRSIEMWIAVTCSLIAYSLTLRFSWTAGDVGLTSARLFPYVLIGLYWPALIMVLRRPNEASSRE